MSGILGVGVLQLPAAVHFHECCRACTYQWRWQHVNCGAFSWTIFDARVLWGNVKLWKWGYGSKGASIARRATALHQELPFTTNDMIHPSQRSRRFWSPVSVLPALKPWHQSRSLDLVHSPWKHGQHKPIPGNITCRRIWLSETHACAGGMKVSRTRLQPSATAIFISTNRAQMCRPGISERAPPPWVTHLASEG